MENFSDKPASAGITKSFFDEGLPIHITGFFLLNLLFALFYILFYIFSDIIHGTGCLPVTGLTPWISQSMTSRDGIELYVLTLAMPAYLFIGHLLAEKEYFSTGFLASNYILLVYAAIIIIFFGRHFIVTDSPLNIDNILIVLAVTGLVALAIVKTSALHLPSHFKWPVIILLFVSILVVTMLTTSRASLYDYNYYLGPGNKILQGERPGTYYMQYNLLGTLLIALLQKCKLYLHQVEFVVIVACAIWIMLYRKAATTLFNHHVMVYLFLLVLMIVRCFAIEGGPACIPQVSTLRLDLWVPLLLLVLRYGFTSVITGSAFALCYLADDIFGLLYLALYIAILAITVTRHCVRPGSIKQGQYLLAFIPAIVAIAIHYALFGALGSASGKIYSKLQLGFLPVAPTSAFWFVAWFIPLCFYILSHNKGNQQRINLFLAGIVCIQLTYFFGRSHDHNLLNISGIFIFILFYAIDKIYGHAYNKKRILNLVVLLIICIGVNYNTAIKIKWNETQHKISNRQLFQPDPLDKHLAITGPYIKSLGYQKLVIISDADSYINYRLKLPQTGYFSPFLANVFAEDTEAFLATKLNQGYRLILYPVLYPQLANDILALHKQPGKRTFVETPLEHGLSEIRLSGAGAQPNVKQ